MQVATLFRESATLLGAASMMESPTSSSSSSSLASSSSLSSSVVPSVSTVLTPITSALLEPPISNNINQQSTSGEIETNVQISTSPLNLINNNDEQQTIADSNISCDNQNNEITLSSPPTQQPTTSSSSSTSSIWDSSMNNELTIRATGATNSNGTETSNDLIMNNHHHHHHHHHQQHHRQQQQQQQHQHFQLQYQYHQHIQQQQQQQQHNNSVNNNNGNRSADHSSSMTCIDELMIDDIEQHNQQCYKILSPSVKHEILDDGYETSGGDTLTSGSLSTKTTNASVNGNGSGGNMTPNHLRNSLLMPKCEIPQQQDDPYNFIDDDIHNNLPLHLMSSESNRNNGGGMMMEFSNAMRHQHHQDHHQQQQQQQQQINLHHDGGLMLSGNIGGHLMNNLPHHNINNDLIGSGQELSSPIGQSMIDGSIIPHSIIGPKKRGRKKKIRNDDDMNSVNVNLKQLIVKERKKHDRFNGMPEEEVSKRTLPDHIANNLDIVIIGINPGLFAAYKGHHYAGPGNHFWKCLYLSGLTREQMTAEEDYKLLKFGIGFTNMVQRATKGSADLTRKEIKEGCRILIEKLRKYRPKIAVFNGKLIFEVFSGKKDFNFGRQPDCIDGTNTYMWVMPSSSARCAQLPRAADKVPFYAALKKFRDYLNGMVSELDEAEIIFNDSKYKSCCENVGPNTGDHHDNCTNTTRLTTVSGTNSTANVDNISYTILSNKLSDDSDKMQHHNCISDGGHVGSNDIISGKKKRGRPKKIKRDGDEHKPTTVRRINTSTSNISSMNQLNGDSVGGMVDINGEMPKKKRGRPKKIKTDHPVGEHQQQQSQHHQMNQQHSHLQKQQQPQHNDDIMMQSNGSNIGGNGDNTTFCSNLSDNKRSFSSPIHQYSTSNNSSNTNNNNNNSNNNTNNNNNNNNNNNSNNNNNNNNNNNISSSNFCNISGTSSSSTINYQQSPQHQSHQQHHQHNYSDLSSEISAAISADHHHLVESPAPTSPSLGPSDFEPLTNMPTDDSTPNFVPPPPPPSSSSSSSAASTPSLASPVIGSGAISNECRFPNSSSSIHPNGLDNLQQHRGYSPYQQHRSNQNQNNNNNSNTNYVDENRSENDHININYLDHHHHQNHHEQQHQQIIDRLGHQSNITDVYKVPDVASKSLSGLESLVDQIPSITDGDQQHHHTQSQQQQQQLHNQQQLSLNNSKLSDKLLTDQFQNSCLYSNYGNNNISYGGIGSSSNLLHSNYVTASSSQGAAAAIIANVGINYLSPNSIGSRGNGGGSGGAGVPPSNSTNSYNSLPSPFSVSSLAASSSSASSSPSPILPSSSSSSSSLTSSSSTLTTAHSSIVTSNNYPSPGNPGVSVSPSYLNSNLMIHHLSASNTNSGVGGGTSASSSIFLEPPHMPVPVSSLYHHPYSHHHPHIHPHAHNLNPHSTYSAYSAVSSSSPAPALPPTIHMPSPNYPYGYTGGYGQPPTSHLNTTHSGYLTNHHHHHHHHTSMFDRIKPDIGYGGF